MKKENEKKVQVSNTKYVKTECLFNIFDCLSQKELVLVIFDVNSKFRKYFVEYTKESKISINRKDILVCSKDIIGNIKNINDFKSLIGNHSENLEKSGKKYLEQFKYFNFYKSLLILPQSLFNSLTNLDFQYSNMGYDGVMILNPFIKYTKNLTSLNLSYNNLNDDGCAFLRSGISVNKSLNTLILECNSISNDGLFYLIDPIVNHINLKIIKFALNSITIDGIRELSSKLMIKQDKVMTMLDFKYNNIIVKEENVEVFKKLKIHY